jgi:hypothetical protein
MHGNDSCWDCRRRLIWKKNHSNIDIKYNGSTAAVYCRTTTMTLLLLVLMILLPSTTSFQRTIVHGQVSSDHHNNRKESRQRRQSSSSPTSFDQVATEWATKLGREIKEVSECVSMVVSAILLPSVQVRAEDIVQICDVMDEQVKKATTDYAGTEEYPQSDDTVVSQHPVQLRMRALQTKRYEYLVKLMQSDYDAYIATATFLSPSRIPRNELPNLQDIPMDKTAIEAIPKQILMAEDGVTPLVADCRLEDKKYNDNILDKLLLSVFRKLVTKNTGGITSDKQGIEGLLEQGRTFLLQPGQTPEAQHKMVYNTLAGLMTPVLPPFYRIFMSGVLPKALDDQERQLGPWFYAPFLTSFVTPTFFGFLVGPSYPNRRKDGQLGGLVVEKCKFLVCLAVS